MKAPWHFAFTINDINEVVVVFSLVNGKANVEADLLAGVGGL